MQASDMETSRLEIGLVALSIFMLVFQMSLIIWVAARRRATVSETAQKHGDPDNPCLWRDVFPDQRGHETVLATGGPSEASSFVEQVRMKSGSLAGAVQHELSDIRRRVSASGIPRRSSKPVDDLETGPAASNMVASGIDRENSPVIARRRSSLSAEGLQREENPKHVRFNNSQSRRRSSWLINLEEDPASIVKPRPRAPSER